MRLSVQPVESKKQWEEFMADCRPHTFLQSWNMGELYQFMGQKVLRLGVYDHSGKLYGVALVMDVKTRHGKFLLCLHGPIVSNPATFPPVLKTLADYLRHTASNEHYDFVRIAPITEKNTVNEKIFRELGFRKAPLGLLNPWQTWILDLAAPRETLLRQMSASTRRHILRAERIGIRIVKSAKQDDIELFWPIYQETIQRRKFRSFSKKYLKALFEAFRKDNKALFLFGKRGHEILSATIVIFDTASAFYCHGASVQGLPKIGAPHLLQWRAILEAKRRGCRFYNFWGVANDDSPKHPFAGLTTFKMRFGGFPKESIPAQDMIVSPKYWIHYWAQKLNNLREFI